MANPVLFVRKLGQKAKVVGHSDIEAQQRSLSRKVKFSNNWKKQKQKVTRIHSRIADKRNDFSHQQTRRIVNRYQIISLENLNVSGMMKNRKLSRAISDCAWYEKRRQLIYKAAWANRTIALVDRFERSTGVCPDCWWKTQERLSLKERNWICGGQYG